MKIVLATKNEGKLKELSELSASYDWLNLCLAPAEFDPEETGKTFTENAQIKAKAAAQLSGMSAIADDSGLIVEALNGMPGIRSARWVEGDDQARRTKLLTEMAKVPEDRRQAAFICTMVVCDKTGEVIFSTTRYWEGLIGLAEKGDNGFGYDRLFYPKNKNISAAELSAAEKNLISHRGQAMRQVLNFLEKCHKDGKVL